MKINKILGVYSSLLAEKNINVLNVSALGLFLSLFFVPGILCDMAEHTYVVKGVYGVVVEHNKGYRGGRPFIKLKVDGELKNLEMNYRLVGEEVKNNIDDNLNKHLDVKYVEYEHCFGISSAAIEISGQSGVFLKMGAEEYIVNGFRVTSFEYIVAILAFVLLIIFFIYPIWRSSRLNG